MAPHHSDHALLRLEAGAELRRPCLYVRIASTLSAFELLLA